MNDFNVGDWVIMDSYMLCLEYYDDYKEKWIATKLHKATENMLHCRQYRRATVLDFIRTLDAEQIAKLLTNCYAVGSPLAELPTARELDTEIARYCSDTFLWLNEPLTDELVEKLGGKK